MEWLAVIVCALAALAFSARYNWWRPRVRGIPILMYHHITDELRGTPLPKLRVSPAAFARQLDWLKAHGYKSLTLGQALRHTGPDKAVVLTFDDGYLNFLTEAWPLLRERGMTATVFLVTDALGGDNFWDHVKGEPVEPVLNVEQVRELAAQGVEFGGHGHRHANLSELGPDELEDDLAICQREMTALLGAPAKVYSYPYGHCNQAVVRAVDRAGFSAACTIRPGMLRKETDTGQLPRIMIKRKDGMLDFWLKMTRTKSTF